MNIGEKIKSLRLENNFSVKDLSEKCNISSSYLYQLERGDKKYPSVETLEIIANTLNVNIFDLMYDSNKLSNSVQNLESFGNFLNSLGYKINSNKISEVDYEINIITPSKKLIKLNDSSYCELIEEFREFIEFKLNKLVK